MKEPYIDPTGYEQAKKVTKNLEGHVIDGGKPAVPSAFFETYEPATSLDPAYAWYWPGLVYMAIGVDRSIFAMFGDGLGSSFSIKTHRSDLPIVGFAGADKATNPWSGTLQGIPMGLSSQFDGYIASYEFVSAAKRWRVTPVKQRVADPFFRKERRGVWCTLLLPELPGHLKVVVTRQAGLLLETPQLGIERA